MYRQIMHTFGSFHNGFGNGRVGVHDAAEFVGGRFEGHRDAGFGEKLGRVRADDVDAEDLVVFFFGDDLDETVGLAEDPGLAGRRERKLADFDVISGLFRFGLGQADACDFRVAIGAVRDEVLFDRLDLFAGDLFDDHDAFL